MKGASAFSDSKLSHRSDMAAARKGACRPTPTGRASTRRQDHECAAHTRVVPSADALANRAVPAVPSSGDCRHAAGARVQMWAMLCRCSPPEQAAVCVHQGCHASCGQDRPHVHVIQRQSHHQLHGKVCQSRRLLDFPDTQLEHACAVQSDDAPESCPAHTPTALQSSATLALSSLALLDPAGCPGKAFAADAPAAPLAFGCSERTAADSYLQCFHLPGCSGAAGPTCPVALPASVSGEHAATVQQCNASPTWLSRCCRSPLLAARPGMDSPQMLSTSSLCPLRVWRQTMAFTSHTRMMLSRPPLSSRPPRQHSVRTLPR